MLWGTTGTSQALAPEGANPLAVGTLRIIVGGLALLALAYFRGGFRTRTPWHAPATVAAAVSTALYQVTFFAGTQQTGVAVGTMIAIGSAPIFAGLLSVLVEREAPSRGWMVATAIAVVGCGVLISGGDAQMVVDPVGVLLSLGAGLSYAVFAMANKWLLAAHTSEEVMAVSFCAGAVLLSPLLVFNPVGWVATPGGAVVVLHLGLVATGASYALFGYGLRTVKVTTAATLSLIEPLTAALLGVFVVREALTGQAVAGMVLIFVGLLVLTIQRG
ncbi:MAG: EamA family transporter [Chloroflexota bacterium]